MPLQPVRSQAPKNRKARRAARKANHGGKPPRSSVGSANTEREQLIHNAAAHRDAGRIKEAVECYGRLLERDAADPQALFGLGLLFVLAEEPDQAYDYLKQAVSIEPDNASHWGVFGRCLKDMGQWQAAIVAFGRATELAPENQALQFELGLMHVLEGNGEKALEALEKAVALDPNCRNARYALAVQQNALGDPDAARASFERVLKIDADFADAYLYLADLTRDPDDQESLAGRIELAIERSTGESRPPASLHFAAAKIRRRQRRYDQAFMHFSTGNETLRQSHRLDRDSVRAVVDSVIDGFTPEVFETLKAAGSDSELPVFVVGMPRSGSTLVEQILSSHRDIASAGEFTKMLKTVSLLREKVDGIDRYPRQVGDIAPEGLAALGEDYLEALRCNRPSEALRIIDKNLNNFFSVGLIAVLFPNARIIHCRRDPMDTCFSCYCQNFTASDQHLVYTNSLEDLGLYYRQYERLMDHWRMLLPGRMFEVSYEDMVADQETISRKLMDHIGLPWDDACLDFHKSSNSTITASVNQVRKPIYKSSVSAWRNYEQHLGPLKRALGIDEEAPRQPPSA